jgi:hypothetical protein
VNSEGGEPRRNIQRLEPYSHSRAQLLLGPTAVLRFHRSTRSHATHKLSCIVGIPVKTKPRDSDIARRKTGSRANPLFFNGCAAQKKTGRPPISLQIRRLIRTEVNPLWRALRIRGELLKLGIAVSERTVSRVLQTVKRPPSQTWRTFLKNQHRGDRCRRLPYRAADSLASIVCLPRHRA